MGAGFVDKVTGIISPAREKLVEMLPQLVGALVLFLVGWGAAALARRIIDRFWSRVIGFFASRRSESPFLSRLSRAGEIIAGFTYWFLLFLAMTLATEVLGLPAVSTWLEGITSYLPRLLVAILIAIAGWIGGGLARDLLVTALAPSGSSFARMVGRMVQFLIVLVSILVAIKQTGIDITLVADALLIVLSALLFGAALAFGLGASASVRSILAAYFAQQRFHVGQRVKIEGYEGHILQFTSTTVVIDTPEGQVEIPARHFEEQVALVGAMGARQARHAHERKGEREGK